MKKEVHYKTHLTDSLISNISNENHFIEIKRCQKRLSTASVSTSSRSSLPKKRIKREDIKSEKEDSGGVQETIQILFFSNTSPNTNQMRYVRTSGNFASPQYQDTKFLSR